MWTNLHLAILREVAAHQPFAGAFYPVIPGYTEEVVSAAVRELADMGMIEAHRRPLLADPTSSPPLWAATRLLPKGRAVLEAAS